MCETLLICGNGGGFLITFGCLKKLDDGREI